MFKINTHQVTLFKQTIRSTFEQEMVDHCTAFSPGLSTALDEEGLTAVVRSAIARAAGHGFTTRGAVRLFIELGLLFGSEFDSDVQYPWARACLVASKETAEDASQPVASGEPSSPTTQPVDPANEQMDRAAALHDASVAALAAIHGEDDRHVQAARRRLLVLAAEPVPDQVEDLPAFALVRMKRVHPEKYASAGAPALRELVAAGIDEAERRGLDAPRDVLLLVGLMFAYGQGCTRDPLHAWIGQTLHDETIGTPAERARHIEERALTAARDALATSP